MNIKTFLSAAMVIGIIAAPNCIAQEKSTKTNTNVVLASEIEWEQLNPARGDKSPQAATLWGDRNGSEATGFLVKFVDGFSSPPHIHNVTYRGVVITGGVHNDDEKAESMWMPPGSFWTQPKGAAHITSARGSTMAYIEIEEGPYLVKPTDEAFDNGERPVNVDPSNIVWLDATNTTWIDQPEKTASANTPQIAFVWGAPKDEQLNGTLVKLPAGFSGEFRSLGETLRAVLIEGKPQLTLSGEKELISLTPGSSFSSKGEATHQISCGPKEGCLIYVRSKGKFKVIPGTHTK